MTLTFVLIGVLVAIIARVITANVPGQLLIGAVFFLIMATYINVFASSKDYYTFYYDTPDHLKVSVQADSKEDAFKKAASLCFKILTNGKYQGETRSLEIIDICVNPK